jgi:hypothetical protein
MVLFSGMYINVEKEGNVYRAFACNEYDNIASVKAFESGLAISSLFEKLRGMALDKEVELITK